MRKSEGDVKLDEKNNIINEKRGFTERSLNILLQKICDYEAKQEHLNCQSCEYKKAAPLIKTMYVRNESRFNFEVKKYDRKKF